MSLVLLRFRVIAPDSQSTSSARNSAMSEATYPQLSESKMWSFNCPVASPTSVRTSSIVESDQERVRLRVADQGGCLDGEAPDRTGGEFLPESREHTPVAPSGQPDHRFPPRVAIFVGEAFDQRLPELRRVHLDLRPQRAKVAQSRTWTSGSLVSSARLRRAWRSA